MAVRITSDLFALYVVVLIVFANINFPAAHPQCLGICTPTVVHAVVEASVVANPLESVKLGHALRYRAV